MQAEIGTMGATDENVWDPHDKIRVRYDLSFREACNRRTGYFLAVATVFALLPMSIGLWLDAPARLWLGVIAGLYAGGLGYLLHFRLGGMMRVRTGLLFAVMAGCLAQPTPYRVGLGAGFALALTAGFLLAHWLPQPTKGSRPFSN